MLVYLPKPLQQQVSVPIIKGLMEQELRQLQGHSSQEAQISFIEAVRQLPLFGYTVYVVLRVSQLALPGPSLLGLNRQHLILMEPSSQVSQAPVPVWAWTPLGHSCPTTHTDPSREGPSSVSAAPRRSIAPSP